MRKALTGARPQFALNPAHLSVPPGQMFHREMEALDQTLLAGAPLAHRQDLCLVVSCQHLFWSPLVTLTHLSLATLRCVRRQCVAKLRGSGEQLCGAWPSRNCWWQQVCTWASGRVTGDGVYGVFTAPVSTMIGFEACFPPRFAFPQNLQA